jgi:hypothetical protein
MAGNKAAMARVCHRPLRSNVAAAADIVGCFGAQNVVYV